MKIANVGIKGLPARFGGWETIVEEISTGLIKKGHKVTVYCRNDKVRIEREEYRGIQLVKVPATWSKHFGTILHSFLCTIHILKTDVEIVDYYTAANAIFAFLPRLFGKKVVCSVDGLDWQRAKWGKLVKVYLKLAEYLAVYLTNGVITDAKTIEKYYLDKFKVRTTCIPCGAYVSDSTHPEWINRFGLQSKRYFLFVGRLTPENNIHHLVKAFERVRTDMKLVIVGDDPYHKAYIVSLKSTCDPRIMFTGYVYGKGYKELNCNAYAYVFPDGVGGTHPALVEAMGFGNCVLVNDTPSNLEVIGEAGLSYKGRNGAEDLRREIQSLADDPDLVNSYKAKAINRIRIYYSWDKAVEKHEKFYLAILGRRVPSGR